jgi:hypothetical protein
MRSKSHAAAPGSTPALNGYFSEIEIQDVWSTDGWATLYARVRNGALLRCPLP